MAEQKIKIYYDGLCRLCGGAIDAIDGSKAAKSFEPVDMYRELPSGATLADVDREVYVVEPSGKVFKGADGVARVLQEYPAWRWLAYLMRLPILNSIAAFCYRVVARNRRRFF